MLSAEQIKKLLPSGHYTDGQAGEIKDTLYTLAELLVGSYINQGKRLTDDVKKSLQNEKDR